MPILSIIVPVYNTEKFLHRCIDAILAQTFTEWELILVNDGSKDQSQEICEDYAARDERIKVINKENEGAGPTRNVGLSNAKGKYVAFPDSDDWLSPDTYEVCIKKIEEANADLLVFGMVTAVYNNEKDYVEKEINDAMPEMCYKTQQECRENWSELYRKMDLGSPCNKIYRRSIIEQHNLRYPALRRMQDGVFNMYYFDKITSFISISNNFYHRTWHSQTFQKKKMPDKFIECAITHHKTMIQLMTSWGVLKESDQIIFGESFSEIVMCAEFEYLPADNSLQAIYRHIKNINDNPYIHSFYKDYKRCKKKIRKRELAMLNRWNLLLALELYLKMKRGKK